MDPYQITFNTWNELAQWYEDTFMEFNLYDHTYQAFCDAILTNNALVLELGCGPGNVTKQLFKLKPDLKILATDVAPTMIEYAKKNNPQADFQLLDVRELHQIDKKFDGIMCGFCLPYLSEQDAAQLISNSNKILNQAGILYLSWIEGDYSKSGFIKNSKGQQTLMFFHELENLKKQLISSGFQIIHHYNIPYPNKETATAVHLVLIARKVR